MSPLARAGLAALALGLGACATTPPVRYYTLLAPPAQTAIAEPPAPFLIDVLPVGVPTRLDQPQLVVRQADSGIVVLDGERWASPLGDEVRNALSSELSHRLGTRDISGLPRPASQPVLRIKVQLRRLDAWPGQEVQLASDWSLGFADEAGNLRLLCGGQYQEPAVGGYPELVQAQQRAIAAMAASIAVDARGFARSRDTHCSGEFAERR